MSKKRRNSNPHNRNVFSKTTFSKTEKQSPVKNETTIKNLGIYKPDIVMSIHGWLSDRAWQSNLKDELHRNGLDFAAYRFKFNLWPWVNELRVKNFLEWYHLIVNDKNFDIDLNNHYKRPSIMAHSLGTWILAKALQQYPEIKFDKIFLFGSIIPSNFDWNSLILNDQVNDVIYEKASKDRVVSFAWIITRKGKPSAKYGFNQQSAFIDEVPATNFGHSTFQYAAHYAAYIKNRLKDHPPHPLLVKQGRSLPDRAAGFAFLKEAIQIDSQVYTDEVYRSTPVKMETLLTWFEVEKDIWTFLVNSITGEIDGYVNAIPVDKATYDKFISGQLCEHDIEPISILNYQNCTEYYLLILSVAVRKSEREGFVLHQGKRAQLLMLGMISKIEEFRTNNKKLKKMGAVAWTPMGERLCQGFGMKKSSTKDDGKGHPIYEVDLNRIREIDLAKTNIVCRSWYSTMLRRN